MKTDPRMSPIALATSIAMGLTILTPTAMAAAVGISNTPLATSTVTVKPNLMFILDDSGSMDRAYMPDDMSDTNAYGYYSSQCNGVYYNPSITYTLPVKADGTSYPNVSYTAAPSDGFNSSSTKYNLTGGFYYKYSGTYAPMAWQYTAAGVVKNGYYNECMATSGSSVFTKVTVSAAEQQNYANWFSYYRKRVLMMRSATGLAFNTLNSDYRVGFTVISDTGVSGSQFLDVSDFNSTQKSSFFTKLYAASPSSYTPLRASLSKIGRYYANTISGQTDPIQYSCQRNYTLLSTDGYWNTDTESGTYGPFAMDGSTKVGQQDGTDAKPMWDGATTTVVAKTPSTTVTRNQTVTQKTTTTPWTVWNWSAAASKGTNGCSSTRYYINKVEQKRNESTVKTTTLVTDTTSTSTLTVTTVNGVSTSSTNTTTGSPVTVSNNTTTDSDTFGGWSNTGNTATACVTTLPTGVAAGSNNNYSTSSSTYTATTNGTSGTATTATTAGPTTTVVSVTGPTPGTTTTTTTTSGGATNSLADVAEYYYLTDLRSSMTNNVRTTSTDPATYQHMNTFTVGLGSPGTLAYDRNYLSQTTGDFADIKSGAKVWPVPSSGDDATHIDDLWHAAVNGRGQYFSATDPDTLADALTTTLKKVTEQAGTGSAAAASTLTPVLGDDWIFLPTYSNAPTWNGDLRAFKFSFTPSGQVVAPDTGAGKELWSARTVLEARTTARQIYFNGGSNTLASFTYANLTTAGLNSSFDGRCSTASTLLTQCADLTATEKATVTGDNLVKFIAGDKSRYLSATGGVFRTRGYLLGDMMNASPAYVGKPPFKYTDAKYAEFVSAKATRTKVVYAAANDGMLHAFKVAADGTGGTELWAFVPTAVIPELWRLADKGYDATHRYYVDGSPIVGDVWDGSAWRTVLVGGLGGGGRGYYALDVTTPESPILLWEFTDTNMGLTYGNPVISKTAAAVGSTPAGTWTVAFSSGYNNNSVGDGKGRLYVRNAVTGAEVITLTTTAGDTTTPSNLGRINAWLESDTNNRALRYYGGDMLGNMWRFDYADQVAPTGSEAFLLAKAVNSSGTAQPITTKPLLSEVSAGGSTYAVLSFGTGRYLGISDLTDTTQQTIYAIKDSLTNTGLGNLQGGTANLVQQTLNSSRQVTTPATVDWTTKNGWYVNLDQSTLERAHVDGTPLAEGVLAFPTTVPTGDACDQGGKGYLYQFALENGNVLKIDTYNAVIVGVGRVINPDGSISATVTTQNQKIETPKSASGTAANPSTGTAQRTTWRELVD